MICDECQALYEEVADRAREAHVFEKVRRTDDRLRCRARCGKSDAEAYYYAEVAEDHKSVYVGLYTPDRWLSESIEADLMFKGDKIEDLLEEELFDRGFESRLAVEHFRDDDKHYVFRSNLVVPADEKLEGPAMVERVTRVLLAYEATFRPLGDMSPSDA